MPDVEVKGESAHYFLLVQGSEDVGYGACRVRMLHSDNQINGAAAMATVSGLLREKSPSSSGILVVTFSKECVCATLIVNVSVSLTLTVCVLQCNIWMYGYG